MPRAILSHCRRSEYSRIMRTRHAAVLLWTITGIEALRIPFISRLRRNRSEQLPKREVRLLQGNIAEWTADAIVTSSNPYLEGTRRESHWRFAGRVNVDAAVRTAGGRDLDAAIAKLDTSAPIEVASAVITPSGGSLRSKWVVHSVAPFAEDRGQDPQQGLALLQATISAAIRSASMAGATSVAVPALGAGVAGFSAEAAAQCAFNAAGDWLECDDTSPLRRIDLVIWADNVWAAWASCARDGVTLGGVSPTADEFGFTWRIPNCDDDRQDTERDARAEAQSALFGGGDFLPGFGSLDVL
jgi:O-acetyl-ADP-ribose deacetylase (regulator of RNase III)